MALHTGNLVWTQMERKAAQAHHSVIVLLDHADEEARVIVVEEFAIDYENVVAVPNCGHVGSPVVPAGRAG